MTKAKTAFTEAWAHQKAAARVSDGPKTAQERQTLRPFSVLTLDRPIDLDSLPRAQIFTEKTEEKSTPWKKDFNIELEKPARRI